MPLEQQRGDGRQQGGRHLGVSAAARGTGTLGLCCRLHAPRLLLLLLLLLLLSQTAAFSHEKEKP